MHESKGQRMIEDTAESLLTPVPALGMAFILPLIHRPRRIATVGHGVRRDGRVLHRLGHRQRHLLEQLLRLMRCPEVSGQGPNRISVARKRGRSGIAQKVLAGVQRRSGPDRAPVQ